MIAASAEPDRAKSCAYVKAWRNMDGCHSTTWRWSTAALDPGVCTMLIILQHVPHLPDTSRAGDGQTIRPSYKEPMKPSGMVLMIGFLLMGMSMRGIAAEQPFRLP